MDVKVLTKKENLQSTALKPPLNENPFAEILLNKTASCFQILIFSDNIKCNNNENNSTII